MMLQRDTVIWKRGILVMPKIVHDLLGAMQVGFTTKCSPSTVLTHRDVSRPTTCCISGAG